MPNNRLVHGTTLHGKQYLRDQYELPQLLAGAFGTTIGQDALGGMADFGAVLLGYDYSVQALTYYHRTGPIGQVMKACNRNEKDRIGVIGLGTGTMASYGRSGQTVVFYDIDKTVKEISFDRRDYFSFVSDARARGVDVADLVLGDARLEIKRHLDKNPALPEREKYSVLAVDAFSSDAIPIHLITKEAVKLYFKTLRKDGILAFHISNRYLDLRPVLANIAEDLRKDAARNPDDPESADLKDIAVSSRPSMLATPMGSIATLKRSADQARRGWCWRGSRITWNSGKRNEWMRRGRPTCKNTLV